MRKSVLGLGVLLLSMTSLSCLASPALVQSEQTLSAKEVLPEHIVESFSIALKKLATAKDFSFNKETREWLLSLPNLADKDFKANAFNASKLIQEVKLQGFCQTKEGSACVKELQNFFALPEDGIAGKQLYMNLALTLAEKRTLLNESMALLENEWQSLSEKEKEKWIIVNIPSFSLDAWSISGERLGSRVIVGRPDRRTPLGRINMWGIKYHPTWNPPPGIMKKDILPKLGTGDHSLAKKGLIAVSPDGEEFDPSEITAEDVLHNGFRLYQPSGPRNALGLLKFETDSKESIYLHDTNDKSLYEHSQRALSSGCIRVIEWKPLAAFVLNKSQQEISLKIKKGKTSIDKIAQVPVSVLYMMAEPSANALGVVVWPDVYAMMNKKEWVPVIKMK